LKEFVPLESVDPVYFESSYYLARVIDLMEALKKSLGSGPVREKPVARKKGRAR
jgi:non-homologous end joining protein Ku